MILDIFTASCYGKKFITQGVSNSNEIGVTKWRKLTCKNSEHNMYVWQNA